MGQDYTNMVYKIAHKYCFGGDFEDLCQVGQLGLLKQLLIGIVIVGV